MTAADLPTTHGIPNNGGEGFRFLGYPAYDFIVNWDFTHTDKLADITPGLFTAWHADETNPLRWICTVRQGVKFHDGSAFNADAVIWNLRRIYDDKSPQYDAPAAPIVRATVSMIDKFEKADDNTIVLTTKYPFSFLPYLLTRILIVSPTQWEKVGKNWAAFAQAALRHRPVQDHQGGTGPICRDVAQRGTIGTRRASRSSTRWWSIRCRKPPRASPRCAPARWTGSRCRRRTPSRR